MLTTISLTFITIPSRIIFFFPWVKRRPGLVAESGLWCGQWWAGAGLYQLVKGDVCPLQVQQWHANSLKFARWETVTCYQSGRGFPGGSRIRLAMQETRVRSLDWKLPWRRKWQPTPVCLPGRPHGRSSWAGGSPRGHKRAGCDLVSKEHEVPAPGHCPLASAGGWFAGDEQGSGA